MKLAWGRLIIERRFGEKQKAKARIQRNSITEYGGLDRLEEVLVLGDKKISGGVPANVVEEPEDDEVKIIAEDISSRLEMNLSIPPRVPCEGMSDGMKKELFKDVESKVFDLWKVRQRYTIFERNLEIWRQFWITCERSDVIIQIVDARNPEFFINDDIRRMYPEKEHVLLVNKADLSLNRREIDGYKCFYYSALGNDGLPEFIAGFNRKTIGFVGYPNVGKSSTINQITNQKRVRVSPTPGKTRYIQTIPLCDGFLLDCPGLVFPRHDKIDLILHGILNVDQLFDLNEYVDYIVGFIGVKKLCSFYSVRDFYNDSRHSIGINYMNAMSMSLGWEVTRCLKNMLKDFVSGKINYDRIDEDVGVRFDWYERGM